MKKAELKKRMRKISRKVFKARVEAVYLLEEMDDEDKKISDDDLDMIDSFITECEIAEDTARNIYI